MSNPIDPLEPVRPHMPKSGVPPFISRQIENARSRGDEAWGFIVENIEADAAEIRRQEFRTRLRANVSVGIAFCSLAVSVLVLIYK